MHDLWSDNLKEGTKLKVFADYWEGDLLKSASIVFAMTDVQKSFIDAKYGIDCKILPHTISTNKISLAKEFDQLKENRSTKTIIFTGNINKINNTISQMNDISFGKAILNQEL